MSLMLPMDVMHQIEQAGEHAYPEEGAGFLLGSSGDKRVVREILTVKNAREDGARENRYVIIAADYVHAESEADERGLEVLGVFHSHPDHPEEPSEFDRMWAQPNFSYLITSIRLGKSAASKSWRLLENRSGFEQEMLEFV
jgi:proteasome lid subunit RPN8/RPN11